MQKGKIFAVGIGPGLRDLLAPRAVQALAASDVIYGYKAYVASIEDLVQDKEVLQYGMKEERERCQAAAEAAASGKVVSMVCGGDAGVYALAGLLIAFAEPLGVGVEVVPGITAATAAAGALGAPLVHDFACISLSDLLTPWEKIIQRVEAAAAADFVIVLYNPRSNGREWQLAEVLQRIALKREASTPVGCVRHAGRNGEEVWSATLEKFDPVDVDMSCTVIVGNSTTKFIGNRVVTPRGYGE